MNDLQIFQIIGIYFLFIGISFFINKTILVKLLNSFAESLGLIFLGGMMALLMGYLLITTHNIWEWKLSLIITILGWMSFLKGLIITILPEWSTKLAKKLIKMKSIISLVPSVITIIGLIFIFIGYF